MPGKLVSWQVPRGPALPPTVGLGTKDDGDELVDDKTRPGRYCSCARQGLCFRRLVLHQLGICSDSSGPARRPTAPLSLGRPCRTPLPVGAALGVVVCNRGRLCQSARAPPDRRPARMHQSHGATEPWSYGAQGPWTRDVRCPQQTEHLVPLISLDRTLVSPVAVRFSNLVRKPSRLPRAPCDRHSRSRRSSVGVCHAGPTFVTCGDNLSSSVIALDGRATYSAAEHSGYGRSSNLLVESIRVRPSFSPSN